MKKFFFLLLIPLLFAACNNASKVVVLDRPKPTSPAHDAKRIPKTDLEKFAACLTEKGAIFYGTEWCPHCKKQKALFGDAMDFVNYIDCDENKNLCKAAGVLGYPTWSFLDGSKKEGVQPFPDLAAATQCSLAK